MKRCFTELYKEAMRIEDKDNENREDLIPYLERLCDIVKINFIRRYAEVYIENKKPIVMKEYAFESNKDIQKVFSDLDGCTINVYKLYVIENKLYIKMIIE